MQSILADLKTEDQYAPFCEQIHQFARNYNDGFHRRPEREAGFIMRDDIKGMILVVDDTPASVSVVETVLTEAGYQVSVATSGEKALDRISTITPDLILLDIMMPGIDGYETCRRLKEEKSTQSIPVIFLSALAETFDKVKGFDLGAVDYVIKPIAPEELLSRVHAHMSLNRLKKQLEHQNSLLQEEITQREQAEESLRRSNEELESRVLERTVDLKATNEELLVEIEVRKQAEEKIRKSEDQFRILADYTYDWEYWINPDRTFVYTTPSCVRITGFTADEFMNDPHLLERIIHPDDFGRMSAHFTQSDLIFEMCSHDFRIISKNGDVRWINHICEPIYAENDLFLGRRVTNRDITTHRQAEDALIESEEKYRSLVENIHIGVYQNIANETGSFIWANQAMATIFGYKSLDEFLQIQAVDLYVYPEKRTLYLEKLLKDGFVRNYDIQMKKRDGTPIWTSVTSHIRYGPDGSIQWIDGIFEDVTDHYQIEELKWKAFAQIEKNIEQFAILNDQIRNPLTIITAYVSVSDIPSRDIIEQQVQRIDDLINMLDKGYVESEKVSMYLRKHRS